MRLLALTFGVLLAAALLCCGTPPTAASCASSCDCKAAPAPQSCPGEWVCNLEKRCAWGCKGTCTPGGVYTCRDGEECNGTICSERTACP